MIRLAIDAANLARDRRGMGRLARRIIDVARSDPRFALTLIADRPRDVHALRAEFSPTGVAASATLRRRSRYDVAWFPFNGMRFSARPPALVSINDAFAFTDPARGRIARFREQTPIRRAARDAARVVTISGWSRSEIARELALDADRIDVVAPAPDPFWCPGYEGVLPPTLAGARFALVVGAGEARKNVRLAIDACARAFTNGDEWLVVVGTLRDADRAYARERALRCGEIAASDTMLRTLYRRADVVLVPSLAEGFGLVAIEALACGAPVVAADAAALPEATGDAAMLLDPCDAHAWARAIRTVLDDAETAATLRARSLARFARIDRDAPARAMLDLFERLARDGRT